MRLAQEDDDYLDIESFVEDNLVQQLDEATLGGGAAAAGAGAEDDGILRTRTYDLSMTYDKYYQPVRAPLATRLSPHRS